MFPPAIIAGYAISVFLSRAVTIAVRDTAIVKNHALIAVIVIPAVSVAIVSTARGVPIAFGIAVRIAVRASVSAATPVPTVVGAVTPADLMTVKSAIVAMFAGKYPVYAVIARCVPSTCD